MNLSQRLVYSMKICWVIFCALSLNSYTDTSKAQGNSGSSGGPNRGKAEISVIDPLEFGEYLSLIPNGGSGEVSVTPTGASSASNLRQLDSAANPARVTVLETFPSQGQPFESDYDIIISTRTLESNNNGQTIDFKRLSVQFYEDNRGSNSGNVINRTVTGTGPLSIELQNVDLPSGDQPGNLLIGGTLEIGASDTGTFNTDILIEALKHHD